MVDIQQKIVGNVEIMLVCAMGTVLGKINDAFFIVVNVNSIGISSIFKAQISIGELELKPV